MMDINKSIALLRKKGITPTRQRVEIASVLFEKPQHVSADQLLNQLHAINSPISKATVYNTLGLFADKGLVKEIVIDATRRFYDTTTSPHHHLYHTDTGELEDITDNTMSFPVPSSLFDDFNIEGVDIIIRVSKQTSPSKAQVAV